MNEFVEECRKEWRRLGVPDPIANEMAADLTADLEEAETEGGSAEDVLGNSAFDPRRFAAAWAGARGVTSTTTPAPLPTRRPVLAFAVAAALALLAVLVGAALLVGRHGESVAVRVGRFWAGPDHIHIVGPQPGAQPFRFFMPGPPFDGRQVQSFHFFGLFLLVLFVAVVVGLAVALYRWSPWSRRRGRSLAP